MPQSGPDPSVMQARNVRPTPQRARAFAGSSTEMGRERSRLYYKQLNTADVVVLVLSFLNRF